MIKISTLFKKDPTNLALVVNEINHENEWVYDEGVRATRKFDGTACAIIGGELYKRYDAKKGKKPPAGAIPCQPEPDAITGHWPHWVKVTEQDKLHNEAWECLSEKLDGTYELCGEKISTTRFQQNFNPEKIVGHRLIKHGNELVFGFDINFDSIKQYLQNHDIEGIVFHHPDGRMCKIRKSDFGIKR